MSGPEARIQRNIQKAVAARGGYVVKIHGSPLMPVGTPDLLVCYKGYFIGMEVKTPETCNDVSPAQHLRLSQITEAGGAAVVVWSVGMAMEQLDVIDRAIAAIDVALEALPTDRAERALDRWYEAIDE